MGISSNEKAKKLDLPEKTIAKNVYCSKSKQGTVMFLDVEEEVEIKEEGKENEEKKF